MRAGRRYVGITVVELIVCAFLLSLLIGTVHYLLVYSRKTTKVLSARTSAQQTTCRAIMRLLTELQEGMEVLSPPPGTTISYALVRDKLSLVRWYYLVPQSGGKGTHELWRYLHDGKLPREKRSELMLQNVRRLTFTCRSEGAIQVNLTLAEDDQAYSILTSVRLRNLPSAEALW